MILKCPICGITAVFADGQDRMTCGKPKCHEAFVDKMIASFGQFKKVTRMTTGQTFKVPIRDIIERGVREQDLDKYPLWEEDDAAAA